MRAYLGILQPKIQSLRNSIRKGKKENKRKAILAFSILVIFWIVIFYFTHRLLSYFDGIEIIGRILIEKFLFMGFFVFFIFLLFSSVIAGISIFFLSRDLEILLKLPLNLSSLYYSRFTEIILHSSWMLAIFGIPFFIAYGITLSAGWIYYVGMIAVISLFLVISVGIGAIMSLLLVRFFPAKRLKDVFILLSLGLVIVLYFLIRLLQPERLVRPEEFFTLLGYMASMKTLGSPMLPGSWASEASIVFLKGKFIDTLYPLFLLMTSALAISFIGESLFNKVYMECWNRSRQSVKRYIGSKNFLNPVFRLLLSPLNVQVRNLISKDVRHFFRDVTQWSQLLLLSALVIVYLYNFSVLPLKRSPLPTFYLQNLISFLNLGLAGFVLSAIALRFIFPAISMERESIWIIISSPMNIHRFLDSKFIMAFIPLLILGELLVVMTDYLLDVSLFMWIISTVSVIFMVFTISRLAVAMGAIYCSYRFENVNQLASSYGGVIFMISSMAFVTSMVALMGYPLYFIILSKMSGNPLNVFQWSVAVICFAAALVLNYIVAVIPIRKAYDKLLNYEY